MKTCSNCRCIYGDDYAGQCDDCGAPMGRQGTSRALTWNPLAQIAKAQAEERSIDSRNHSQMHVDTRLMETARGFVIGPADEE